MRPAIARIAIASGSVALAIPVVLNGLATRLERSDPILAAQVAPYDARIAGAAARASVEGGADVSDPAVEQLVQAALRRDVTIPATIEYRALAFGAQGDRNHEARLFDLSDAISRRSLGTRLWLIQRSVDGGDVAGALKNFDTALRTSMGAQEILFPILAGATSDPALVLPIARMVDRPSDWRIMFLNYAISEAGAARDIAEIAIRMRDRTALIDNGVDQRLVGQLVAERQFSAARRVQDRLHPTRSQSRMVRDPNFADARAVFPFGWSFAQKGDGGAARDIVAGRSALSYQAPSGSPGQVAAQLLMLTPGRYRLKVTAASPPTDPSSPPYWTMTCAEEGGRQLALIEEPNAGFTVPAGCNAQWLAFNLRGSDAPGGQSGAIRSVSVKRISD